MVANEMNEVLQTLKAKDLNEAKKILYAKYKNDYEIKDKRVVLYGGFFGLGQKEFIEVSYVHKKRSSIDSFKQEQDALVKLGKERLEKAGLSTVPNYTTQFNDINRRLDEIAAGIVEKNTSSTSQEHSTIQKIQDLLSQNEFSFSYIKKISERIKQTFSLEQLDDFDFVQRNVVDWIGESISIAPKKLYRKPHVVVIVGPTGVGKTTTLVKLAAQYVLSAKTEGEKASLCFVSTDTMRVGAFEQLSRWGAMFSLDVKKAETASDVSRIYEDEKDHVDAIFIDTSGYSPNDSSHIGAMKAVLDVPGLNPDVYLAVSASTKSRDLQNIMQNYEPFGYKSVIITKCDESGQFGNVISTLCEKNKDLAYITTGQNAARCIEKANPIYFLIRLEDFKIDRVHIEDKFGVN